ncbi:MAG TPA: aminotransferase class III-fold pyridoxal phosphate-dependent enzyme, partial [Pirellulales bacterium]|nr:aminotransferase class III-fold pyridoxal phosphate-dependent enzyme [Pirellulales bacterium]
MATSKIVQDHREYLFPAVAMYYQEPLALVRGEGMYVWDDAGRKYLDAWGGVLTISVGHANPKVVEAIVEQVKTLSHVSTLYANGPQSSLARRMAEIAPGKLQKSFFTNSGTEANETAFAAARHATGRSEFVTLRHSYSGRAAQALAASGQAPWKRLPTQVPGFVHAHAPYCYRCPFHLEYPACGLACADDIEELIQTTTTGEIAAFMAETIIGSGGYIVPPPGYFERAVAIARKYGGLFIADEVQTVWGR